MSKINKEFGGWVTYYRMDKDMTLPELSAKTKLSKGVLSQIENGKGNPTLDTISRLSKALGINVCIY